MGENEASSVSSSTHPPLPVAVEQPPLPSPPPPPPPPSPPAPTSPVVPAVAPVASAASPVAPPAAPVASRVSKNMDLPNLFLSSTYALNKSNSKRIVVGLEHYSGFYRVVVKLCSTGSPAKYITLDKNSWELLVDQLDAMIAYVLDSFTFYNDFGKPTKIFLPYHDINFATAYGSRAILIDQRPSEASSKFGAHLSNEESQFVDSFSQMETPCKKRRYESPPAIIMQEATLSGLREVRECVTEWIKRLEDSSAFINQSNDRIIDFLKTELNKEGSEKAKCILKDYVAFKQFCALRKNEINNAAKLYVEFANINADLYDIYLVELHAFGLWAMANDLYDYMFSK